MTLAKGQVIEGRYRIETKRPLGAGGMGAVFLATDLRLEALVAIKENRQTTEAARERFAREARLLYQLVHPNLPRVIDYFSLEGQGQYLVMDYIDGPDLGQILDRGPLTEEQALAWFDQVLDALEYLHSHGIVHRDLKPANVKITPQGRVFLVDFGLAREFEPLDPTTKSTRWATPGFAPPEQYGEGRIDARSDLYSAGATLYAMLTGQKPPVAPILAIDPEALRPPRAYNPGISVGVETAVLRCLSIHPNARFQSVAEFRDALQKGVAPVPKAPVAPAAEPPSRPAGRVQLARSTRPSRARAGLPGWLWLMAGGVAALFLILLTVWFVGSALGPAPTSTPEWTTIAVAVASPSPQPTNTVAPSATIPPTATPSRTAEPSPTASSTPTELSPPPPTVAPVSGRFVFASDRDGDAEIYVMNADGSGVTQLTHNDAEEGKDTGASWSPDGRQIVFWSKRDGQQEVYIMAADGSDQRNLSNHPANDHTPTWSPDGQRVIFMSERDGNQELYLVAPDGSGLTRLTNARGGDGDPTWSPDGSRIAFISGRTGKRDIFVMNSDGSGQRNLTQHPDTDRDPAWSHDMQQIAFWSDRNGNKEIYVMNADGSGLRNLTSRADDDTAPAWSPDDRRIAFVSGAEDNQDVYIMNANGSGQWNLTGKPANYYYPTWLPDGSELTFVSDRDGDLEIYVVSADGSGLTNLTNDPGADIKPSWTDR